MICQTALMAAFPHVTDGWRPAAVGSVDHVDLPLRCHYEDEDDMPRCAEILEYISQSWTIQVNDLGFRDVIFDDDGIFDVYLSSDGTGGGAYVMGEGADADPDDGRMAQPSFMALDPSISDEEMESYVAHEFNHVLQYSTDFLEPTLPIWEATATAAEAWTIPGYKVWGPWVADFQTHTWMGLLGDSYILWDDHAVWSYHEYGAAIWILHLDNTYYGGTGASGSALWGALEQDGRTNEPDVLDGWGAVTGGDWTSALEEFVAFELVSGDVSLRPEWVDDHDDGYWGAVPYSTVHSAELPTTVSAEFGVAPTGWLQLELPDAPEGLAVDVDTSEGVHLSLVAVDADGNTQITRTLPATLELSGPLQLAILHLGDDDFDADDRLELDPMDIQLSVPGSGPDDTAAPGDTGDTADPDGLTGPDPDDDDDGRDASDGNADSDKGGGCATAGLVGGGWLWALALVARRRSP